jgi:hypothetical protein
MRATVACPACRDAVAVDAVTRASRRARCGCGARFDLLPPRAEGEAFGPYRGDGQEARLTPPPVNELIVDLSGRRRTRFVRIHRPAVDTREQILRGLGAGALFGLAFAVLAWAVVHSVGSHASGIVFLAVFAVVTIAFATLVTVRGMLGRPREIWIEEGALHWGRNRSRSLSDIDGVCQDTHALLAFPVPSGPAERFVKLDDLTDEAREWLVQHLNDGIALARADHP